MLTATFDEKMNMTAEATIGPAAALLFTTVSCQGNNNNGGMMLLDTSAI